MPAETPSLITEAARYRGMDRAAIDAAYNNSAAVADSPDWLLRWQARSALVRGQAGARLDQHYAAADRARLDYFSSGVPNAPLFVFIHGGYWFRNSKETFSFVAEGPLSLGMDVAVLGYTLAPAATLTEIVDQVGQALQCLRADTEQFSFRRDQVFAGGWSAGGQLAAMACARQWVRGAVPISGIFDLAPIALSYINEELRLTPAEIELLSPARQLRPGGWPQRLVVGGNELSELQRQSRDYAAQAQAMGLPVTLRVLPGHHHFSILDELASPGGAIVEVLAELLRDTGGAGL
jgi:arylformamidase